MSVIFLTNDLLFSSRVSEAARQRHVPIKICGSAEAACQESQSLTQAVVLIDLTARSLNVTEAVAALRGTNSQLWIVAFGPHVHAGALAAAQQAGCDEVLTRGQFDREIGRLLDHPVA